MPFVSQKKTFCLTDEGHVCLSESAAVEVLEERKGAQYIVLYIRIHPVFMKLYFHQVKKHTTL